MESVQPGPLLPARSSSTSSRNRRSAAVCASKQSSVRDETAAAITHEIYLHEAKNGSFFSVNRVPLRSIVDDQGKPWLLTLFAHVLLTLGINHPVAGVKT